MDDTIVFGQPLVEAYQIESTTARVPRIALSSGVLELVKKHLAFYGDPFNSPQNRDVLIDTDGVAFINYLDAPYTFDQLLGVLVKHKERVEEKLAQFRAQPQIWAKYAWVAEYHNFVCKKWLRLKKDRESRLISGKLLKSSPHLLVRRPRFEPPEEFEE